MDIRSIAADIRNKIGSQDGTVEYRYVGIEVSSTQLEEILIL